MSQQAEDSLASGAALDRAGWRLQVPAEPPRLEPARLLAYRYPSEHLSLAVSVTIIAALLVVAALLDRKEILVAVAVVWLTLVLTSLQAATYNMLRGAEVTPTQFPAMYQIVEELRERFQAPPTRVFVVRVFSFTPETLGFRAPYVIVLPAIMLDSLEGPDELRYVLGRAFGHIRFGHTRLAILLGGDPASLPTVLSWVAKLRDLVFAWYRRAQVFSADRAGIVACGSVRVALETQGKLAIGTPQFAQIRPEDMVEQAFNVTQGSTRLQATMILLRSLTPPLIYRLQAMVAWAGLPERPADPVG